MAYLAVWGVALVFPKPPPGTGQSPPTLRENRCLSTDYHSTPTARFHLAAETALEAAVQVYLWAVELVSPCPVEGAEALACP